jgi:hypothetical protein
MNDMPNDASAIYLFCFARRQRLPVLETACLDLQHPVSLWPFKDIIAVLGTSSIDDFCGPEADNRMKDLAWIGPRACRHEQVVEEVMRHSQVFPARFGTIFSSLNALEKLLDAHYDEILRFLDKAAGKEEWAVKGLLNRAQARIGFSALMLSREEGRLASLSPGKRYLSEKRIKNSADRELNSWLKEVIKGIGNELCLYSFEFCERKVLSLDSEKTDIVLNWAFLVARKSADDFRAGIERANEQNDRQGLLLQLSGPWPPYSFLPSLGC